jgi:hypothetical protein
LLVADVLLVGMQDFLRDFSLVLQNHRRAPSQQLSLHCLQAIFALLYSAGSMPHPP